MKNLKNLLCRAINEKGDFVVGYYLKLADMDTICTEKNYIHNIKMDTLGRYVGETHGLDVFEGDIIARYYLDGEVVTPEKFDDVEYYAIYYDSERLTYSAISDTSYLFPVSQKWLRQGYLRGNVIDYPDLVNIKDVELRR